jgi:hypothetical protein
MTDVPLSEDLIEGAIAIGAEYGFDPHRTFVLMEAKVIPAFKLRGRWFARRSTIRRDIEQRERGAA